MGLINLRCIKKNGDNKENKETKDFEVTILRNIFTTSVTSKPKSITS